MPAIITHDFFGRNVYDTEFSFIGGSRDEADAFLLGNQGPDPLFFSVLSPRLRAFVRLGNVMHDRKPTELIHAMRQSLTILNDHERPVGRAYALGFLCHYLLDTTVHPFVNSQIYAICGAGVEGLNDEHQSQVHHVIESELDEMVLFVTREETIRTFDPSKRILKATDFTLGVISKMYAYVALTVYGQVIPEDMFAAAVRNYRTAQSVLHSPDGTVRVALGNLERLVRDHSTLQAITLQPVERAVCDFDNRDRAPWKNPFTGQVQTESFWDLYESALDRSLKAIHDFDRARFGLEDARAITGDCDFNGETVVAVVTAVEDAPKPTGEAAGANA